MARGAGLLLVTCRTPRHSVEMVASVGFSVKGGLGYGVVGGRVDRRALTPTVELLNLLRMRSYALT